MANIRRWQKREKIKAINDKELKKLLINWKIVDSDLKGTMKCSVCNQNITFDEISAIFQRKDRLFLVCQKIDCIKKLTEED